MEVKFYEISVELTIFRLQYSTSTFGNQPLWKSLRHFGKGSIPAMKTCVGPTQQFVNMDLS